MYACANFSLHMDPRGHSYERSTPPKPNNQHICPVCRSNEVKLAHTAELNAHMACENLQRLRRGDPLLKYPEGITGGRANPKIYCVSLGVCVELVRYSRLCLVF